MKPGTRWIFVLVVAACGGGGSDPPQSDAPPSTPQHYDVCQMGVAADCPAGDSCQVRTLLGGSTTWGYCSPPCTEDLNCEMGYTGPGTPTCFMPDECMIVCTDACPTGLTCLETGGPVRICGVAE
jgi:hypothetical protein